ncbi:septum site-determining protein MinC [Moellerella wisconsensis]|uniref:Septum site-determining protein MinC n=1 Tax=Moellerella wisconsensis TaxID=158849 RepID=A0ACD3YEE9_9GAMM|nr:septum site-determining protein MinC [Moellerella wisconsensis]KLN96409.1 septum formation inhibitor [Moellerella wisconsensis]UNH25529.1 septum site-determining protein MinC [Moellerella wisconsensis]UNH28713.1 septum site-determining protein MinC [Moellerella wisconsensis]UNH40316.1 septum site-determining protein MinC [Moellerella wisconsensis]UNH43855.1 septum site-determining protein MinC [Moellerella wisconsensis]
MSQSPIELKGSNFTLSVLHLYSEEPKLIKKALQEKMKQAPGFLTNAPVVINVSALTPTANLVAIQNIIQTTGLKIVGISGCTDPQLREQVTHANLPLLSEGKGQKVVEAAQAPVETAPEPAPAVSPSEPQFKKTRIIDTPVRSGQRIYAPNSDLIVTSNISAGAELLADGNIHIYGMMRGRALAGASGDTESQIYCTHLQAELVSIAGEYWLSEQIPTDFIGKATRLSLVDNKLHIENLI